MASWYVPLERLIVAFVVALASRTAPRRLQSFGAPLQAPVPATDTAGSSKRFTVKLGAARAGCTGKTVHANPAIKLAISRIENRRGIPAILRPLPLREEKTINPFPVIAHLLQRAEKTTL